MDRQKLNEFIYLLQKVYKQPGNTFDLGLIVKEPDNFTSVEEVFNEIKKIVPIERIIYDRNVTDEEVVDGIVKVIERNTWVFLDIKKDLGSLLLNQLKHLGNYNSFQILNYRGKDVFELKMPESVRLIVFVERNFFENQITYPHFYSLFGPTLSLK